MSFRICRALALASLSLATAPTALAAGPYTGSVTLLYNFTGGLDGNGPSRGLIGDSFGNLYGTTIIGGQNNTGTIFKLDSGGDLTTLYEFAAGSGKSYNRLTLLHGRLYGSAQGGPYACPAQYCGILYSIRPDGSDYTVLHDFNGKDGFDVSSPLVAVPGGGLAGVTQNGGHYADNAEGDGVVFLYQPGGQTETLHYFDGTDGDFPNALLADQNGNLFGSTELGGPACPANRQGCGVIFEIIRQSRSFKLLYTFTGGSDSSEPILGSIDSQGVLYGATRRGITGAPDGIVFALTPTGSTYQFSRIVALKTALPGDIPGSGPVPGPDHGLIGTTQDSVYAVINGLLYHASFGGYELSPLSIGANFSYYGTCTQGTCGNGAIFRYTVTRTAN